jgi:hypothetical protein
VTFLQACVLSFFVPSDLKSAGVSKIKISKPTVPLEYIHTIEGQTGQNYLHGFLLRAVNRGRDKDREKGPKPSNCLKEARCLLAKP